jgi:hypothetical protein
MSHDKNLITGQNPWSVWSVAETVIKQLGHEPKHREITAEENAVDILIAYHQQGSQKAKELIEKKLNDKEKSIDRLLIAKHSIIAAMKGDVSGFFNIIGLVSFVKKMELKA